MACRQVAKQAPRRAQGPRRPRPDFTPNEKYASLIESAGYVPLAFAEDDYVELLPATWRAVNSYGIEINHRIYGCPDLGPLRRQPSGATRKRDLWKSTAPLMTPTGSGSATTGRAAGSRFPGNTSAPSRSPSATWPGTTPRLTCASEAGATRPRNRSPKRSRNS